MDCKKVEEGVVVLGDKKKALLSFLVRDVDIERTIKRRTEEKSTADNTLYFHTHTHTKFCFFTYLANRDISFACLDFASRISE